MEQWLCAKKIILSFCILVFAYFLFLPFSTQDGPNHKKVALMLSRLADSPAESSIYESKLGPLHTNELFPLIYKPLSRFISVDLYERLFVAFFMAFMVGMYAYFLKTWHPPSFGFWPCVLPLCFHPLFLMGMYNFLASVSLSLLALAWLKRGLDAPRFAVYWMAFSLLCWVLYLAHPFPFFVFPLCLLLLGWKKPCYGGKRLASFALPIFFFLVVGFLLPLFESGRHEAGLAYKFNSIPELLGGLFVSNSSGFSLLQILLGLPYIIWMLFLAKKSLREEGNGFKKFWLAILLAYCLFPNEGNQGAYLNNRFLPYLWFFIPLGLPFERSRKAWIALPLLLWGILCLLTFAGLEKVETGVNDARKVYQQLPPSARLYSINFDTQGSTLNLFPYMHLWANYPDAVRAFSPYLFAHSELMPLHRKIPASATYFPATREDFPKELRSGEVCSKMQNPFEAVDCVPLRSKGYDKILETASYYDYWFIHAAPEDFLHRLAQIDGLSKVSESGGASLWHYANSKNFEPELR